MPKNLITLIILKKSDMRTIIYCMSLFLVPVFALAQQATFKGKMISGLDTQGESLVFHAGTSEKEGKIVTAGGRVLAITSLDTNFKDALKKSYSQIEKISFENMYYRKDIGLDL